MSLLTSFLMCRSSSFSSVLSMKEVRLIFLLSLGLAWLYWPAFGRKKIREVLHWIAEFVAVSGTFSMLEQKLLHKLICTLRDSLLSPLSRILYSPLMIGDYVFWVSVPHFAMVTWSSSLFLMSGMMRETHPAFTWTGSLGTFLCLSRILIHPG